MKNEDGNFVKSEMLKLERNFFFYRILAIVVGYIGITLWLNTIRATAPIWFVWVLIVSQFALYFSIFIAGYRRSKVYGLNKNFAIILFTVLAVLGRVNDWELLIIPVLVLIMLIYSSINKNVSKEN